MEVVFVGFIPALVFAGHTEIKRLPAISINPKEIKRLPTISVNPKALSTTVR